MLVKDLALFQQIVVLAGHLAWPLTVIMLFWLIRQPVYTLLAAIADRVKDTRSNVSLGPSGINIDRVADAVSGFTETGNKLNEKLLTDDNFEGQLKDWLLENDLSMTPTAFINLAKYETFRKEAVQHFNL